MQRAVSRVKWCAGVGEAFARLALLRVGEGDPDLVDFVGAEERFDEFHAGADERHVWERLLGGVFRAFPEPRALDVDADIVLFGEAFRQGDGVFTFAAAQFEDDGVVVVEHLLFPVSLQRMVAPQQFFRGGLHEAGERLVLPEFFQFAFSHAILS